jgi:hypothetical protein
MDSNDRARNLIMQKFDISANKVPVVESQNQGPNDTTSTVQPRDLSTALEQVLEKKNEEVVIDSKVLAEGRKKFVTKSDTKLLNEMVKHFL